MTDFDYLSDDELNARLENRHVPERDRRWLIQNRDSDPDARQRIAEELE